MHQRITSLKANPNEWTLRQLLEQWVHYLQDHDRSAATIKKYTQAVDHFLSWHEHEEQSPLILSALTPIHIITIENPILENQPFNQALTIRVIVGEIPCFERKESCW